MTKKDIARLETGVRNLDPLLRGGIPAGAVVIIGGPPGAGKTILAQQICFHNVSAKRRALYFGTLSEPTAKTLRYLSQFSFFDPAKRAEDGIRFVDLGTILRDKGLEEAANLVVAQLKEVKPAIVVIDSFKVFDDLARSREELRKFGYALAVHLMVWETTAFLLGEYGPEDIATNPLFSIIDGVITVKQREQAGEQQRFLQVSKMRGTDHSRDEHAFSITSNGIEIFSPRVTIQREDQRDRPEAPRLATRVSRLDELLGQGIPLGSSLLVAGVAGTGKTVMLLEYLYRGAQAGEKGIMFSFEETEARLRAAARGLGWDLDAEIERGRIEIVFIPQPNISVEEHLLMMQERVEALGARRVAIDSVSVFLHKVKDPQLAREKVFQLASIVQNAQAVGFFATDIPYGTKQISRFGVEETVVDGVILLTSKEVGYERQRYIEIYKLRNTAHFEGRHDLQIGHGGVTIYPRYQLDRGEQPPPVLTAKRLPSGIPGFDAALGGGLLERSVTLVSGSAGIGKTTLSLQFLAEGVKHGQPGLFVALEETPDQIRMLAKAWGIRLGEPRDGGVDIMYLPPQQFRTNQFLAILSDRIRSLGARRLVIDGVSQLVTHGEPPGVLMQALTILATRFKRLGVTSLLTLEASALFSTETVTERGLSPVADNLVMLRYEQIGGTLAPRLTVIKARGSTHDRSTREIIMASHGIQIGPPVASRGKRSKSKRRP